MTNIVVAFSKQEDARSIKNILMRSGFQVVAVCTSGAQVLSSLEDLSEGIVISGYRFEDMLYRGIRDYLPAGFEMLLVASPNRFGGILPRDVRSLPMPLKVHDLVAAVDDMCRNQIQRKRKQRQEPTKRSEKETLMIQEAKEF